MKLTPIAIFTYNRMQHIEKLLISLKKNREFDKSEIYIFSDGGKNDEDWKSVNQVRNFIKSNYNFSNIQLLERTENYGLAKSIIEGITKIFDKYESVIALEDDLIVSSDFIEYMNKALCFYQSDERVWSISGYSPTLKIPRNYDKELYLIPRASSWGWGTWRDRWKKCQWNSQTYTIWNDKRVQESFNVGGNDMFKMLELQKLGKINSWAIRWDYSRFINSMLTVYPLKTKVINEGFDGSGTHTSGSSDKYLGILNNEVIKMKKLETNELIVKEFKKFRDLDWIGKIGYFSKKNGWYDNIKKFKKFVRK
ncbi:MAG: glycosyltransferase [Fusobacteria bacterium]|nr:glycosyltransferase [Fusobacteriota bacterium]